MATTKAVNANVDRPNGGMVIPTNYTLSSTNPVTNTALRTAIASPTIVRTTSKDGDDTNKILSGGTYGYEGGTIVNIATSTIADGQSHTLLKHMGPTQFALRPLHSQASESFRQVPEAIRNGYWNVYSGVFSTAPDVVTTTWITDYGTIPSGGVYVRGHEVQLNFSGRTLLRQHLSAKTQ